MEEKNGAKEKKNRPAIPESVKSELWARAAGRCEFRGCNKFLLEDTVTKKKRKINHIAHIVSWTPSGPRGNENSEKLAKDISNLMLTCVEHNNLIDDPKYVDEYPVELLQQYKREHEERIRRVTGLGKDYGTRIVKMYSKIQDQTPQISDDAIYEAIMPYYPLDTALNIDLTQVEDIETAKKQIKRHIDLHVLSEESEISYSIFCMCKIPYTCYLGYVLGNKVKSEIYQFFRDTQDWKWKEGESGEFQIIRPSIEQSQSDVDLLIEVSGNIDRTLIPNYPVYSLKADKPGFLFLKTRRQVIEFVIKFRELLSEIRDMHGEKVTVHLILAAPNPIVFELGKAIMKNIDPTIVLYDKVSDCVYYQKIMNLHDRIRED